MAIIHSNPNGKLRGRLGPLYAKIVKGRNIFCIMPPPRGKFTEEQLDKMDGMKRFRAAARFAKGLNKILEIRVLNELIKGGYYSAFTSLVSKNVPKCSGDYPSSQCIVAVDGFGYDVSTSELTTTNLAVTLPKIGDYTEMPDGAVDVTIAGTILFTVPMIDGEDKFVVSSLVKDVSGFNFGASYNLTQALSSYQQRMANAYQNHYALFTVILKDAEGRILKNSKTVCVSG